MPKKRGKKIGVRNKDLEVRIENKREISQPPVAVAEKINLDDGQEEKRKRMFMWVGVSSLMVIFFVVWLFTLKYEFRASIKKSAKNEFNWNQTREELAKTMAQVKQGLAEIKKMQKDAEPKLTEEQMDLLKGKLLNETATGTASGTVNNDK